MTRPVLTVIAGPNGAGKSTIYNIVKPTGRFINADDIEASLHPYLPKADREKAAARAALNGIRASISSKHSLVVETTLSGNWPLRLMKDAKDAGYEVDLVFIILGSAQQSIERVAFRVKSGGHDVPTPVLLRRYPRSLANVPSAAMLADEVALIDNSDKKPRWVLKYKDGEPLYVDLQTPLDERIFLALYR